MGHNKKQFDFGALYLIFSHSTEKAETFVGHGGTSIFSETLLLLTLYVLSCGSEY